MSAGGPELSGRRALVAGGGGGLGRAVSRALLDAGAHVYSVDLPGQECVEGAEAVACDLTQPAAIDELFSRVGERLDILVHCVGITRDAVLWKLEEAAWSEVLRVNLDSAFLLLRRAIPLMRAAGGGAAVLVSSINGERGKFGQSNYAASKAGLIALGRTAARETGRFGIRVNIVAPGMIETPMIASLPDEAKRQAIEETALGRLGAPEDVAAAVRFLVSPASRHVTGQVLRVDGGQLIG